MKKTQYQPHDARSYLSIPNGYFFYPERLTPPAIPWVKFDSAYAYNEYGVLVPMYADSQVWPAPQSKDYIHTYLTKGGAIKSEETPCPVQ